jgi:NADH-quinone oxidoreductase subunit H
VFLKIFRFLSIFIVLLSVAFLVLFERKILRLAQIRIRPNIVRFFRILQTVFDRVKLLTKENIFKNKYFYFIYDIIPKLFLTFSLSCFIIFRSFQSRNNIFLNILFLLFLSLLIIFPSILSG